MKLIFSILIVVSLHSCENSPQPLIPGQDICKFCKMPVADPKFGGEIITKKGKLYKFDDMGCLIKYLKSNMSEKEIAKRVLAVNYAKLNELIDVQGCVFIMSSSVHTPMNSGIIALASNKIQPILKEFSGNTLHWDQLLNK